MHALMRAQAIRDAHLRRIGSAYTPVICRPCSRTMRPCGVIECHLARANPHCKELAGVDEALMIFQGRRGLRHAELVSIESRTRQGRADLELCGRARLRAAGSYDDADWLRRHVGELTAQQERDEQKPWALTDAPASYIDTMLRGIVGFRFTIVRHRGQVENESEPRQRRIETASQKVSANGVAATIWKWLISSRVNCGPALE